MIRRKMMTPERLNEIKAMEDCATARPWKALWSPKGRFTDLVLLRGEGQPHVCFGVRHGDNAWNDCEFIALARDAVPELVAEVERLRTILAENDGKSTDLQADLAERMREAIRAEHAAPEAGLPRRDAHLVAADVAIRFLSRQWQIARGTYDRKKCDQ